MPYKDYIVTTVKSKGGGSSANLRVVPVKGQGLDTNMKVRCSRKMRDLYDIGTLFRIKAKITDREGGTPFLDCTRDWAYEVVTEKEANSFIEN